MAEELAGRVTHYFAKPQIGVVQLTAGIKVGDTLAFRLSGSRTQKKSAEEAAPQGSR